MGLLGLKPHDVANAYLETQLYLDSGRTVAFYLSVNRVFFGRINFYKSNVLKFGIKFLFPGEDVVSFLNSLLLPA